MKLACIEVVFMHACRVGQNVFGCSYCIFANRYVIAVHEVEACAVRDVVPQRVFDRLRQWPQWWIAPAASGIVGQAADTLMFFSVAFWRSSNPFMAANWMEIALVDYVIKLLVSLAVFVPLLLFAQQFVWYADTSSLTTGQAARACAVLREAGLQPGAAVTEAKLTAGEYALLHSGEFSWASLNFAKGRLVVEAAAARPKPDIAAGTLHGIRARCSGTVLRTNLTSGTMLVQPGQQVEAGQGLIGTARAERDGTLIFAPAAGTVVAQFEWSDTRTVPLEETVQQYTGACTRAYRVTAFGHTFPLPAAPAPEHAAVILRHFQPEVPLLGLALPCSVEETCRYVQQPETLHRTEAQAAALARLQSLQALYAAWPDAEHIARKEDCTVNGNVLDYTVTYTVAADICG